MNNILWVVKRKLHSGYDYPFTCETRQEARMIAEYYNGFSHRTKHARYRVKKYREVATRVDQKSLHSQSSRGKRDFTRDK